MMLVPYINEKIDNKENVIIKTEKNLNDTVGILISKMNLNEENKKKILGLGWDKEENKNIEEKSNIIIIGTEDYIQNTNNQIKDLNFKEINVVDCYNFDDVKDRMTTIVDNYDKSLNTTGFNKF